MKIAFVISSLAGGGAERVVSLLSQEMSKKHDVHILLFNREVIYEYGGKIIDLKLVSKKSKISKIINFIKRVVKLKQIFKKEKYDKIYSFMESANIPALIASKKTIVSIRNNPLKFGRVTRVIIRFLYKKAPLVIVNSTQNRFFLNKYFNLNNVQIIYNPLDIKYINEKSKEEEKFNYKYIVSIGRLDYQKGFDILINAFSQTKTSKKVKLLIFGNGKMKSELEKLIISKKLENDVFLMGRVDNPYKYLYNAEFFILSSRYEGFPNVLIESLACGTASISTNCPTGPSEIITSELNGLLVEPENISQMSKAIDRLYFDKELKNKFQNNSVDSVKHLSIDKITAKWMEL